jgi:glucose dehydrogenase
MYRIDLATAAIEATFDVERRSPAYYQGVGGSPAVVGGRVYFTAVPGWVYCLDATTFACLWRTDLRNADAAHNQPVNNNIGSSYKADSWSSPLVVNGRVYVGCGEGEDANTYGFVYCLNALTGNVVWLYCTNKASGTGAAGADNTPNVIPVAVAVSNPLPAWAVASGFSVGPNPSEAGSSVWSSCAYAPGLDRIYVGTGNSAYATGTDQPDERYGSGLLALDATTGAFRGFHQSSAADSYRAVDADIDVCGSPTVFTRAGQTVVGYGSKNGAYFVLDAATLAEVAKRQLLPKDEVTGAALPNVDPGGAFENQWGIYGTAALHYGLNKLFVGVGGRIDIDNQTTPFVRALDWNSATLADAWPSAVVAVGGNQVRKYTAGTPPLYSTAAEVGLSSPAVVNDVVFVSTNKPAMYAFDVATGNALWTAPGLPAANPFLWILGPAIYGNRVVIGCGGTVYIYSL